LALAQAIYGNIVGTVIETSGLMRNKMFLGNVSRPVNYVVGGWGLAGTTTWERGLPFTPRESRASRRQYRLRDALRDELTKPFGPALPCRGPSAAECRLERFCEEVGEGWEAAVCADRHRAKARAYKNIGRTQKDIFQEASGRRQYVSATDLLALS
jgi:hypothetical protein